MKTFHERQKFLSEDTLYFRCLKLSLMLNIFLSIKKIVENPFCWSLLSSLIFLRDKSKGNNQLSAKHYSSSVHSFLYSFLNFLHIFTFFEYLVYESWMIFAWGRTLCTYKRYYIILVDQQIERHFVNVFTTPFPSVQLKKFSLFLLQGY